PVAFSRLIAEYKLKFIHLSRAELESCVSFGPAPCEAALGGSVYNYAANALRLEKNEKILLIDGSNSKYYLLAINRIEKKRVTADCRAVEIYDDIIKKEYNCFVGVLKGHANEEIVERLTELGADSIFFFRSRYSQCDIGPEKLERLYKIALSASSQSRRLKAPLIQRLSFEEAVRRLAAPGARSFLMAEPSLCGGLDFAGAPAEAAFEALRKESAGSVNIVSGPEGGFERDEASGILGTAAAIPVTLKNVVLRACFAPQAALAIIKYRCGDL
ncbi:MAG TPA: RsmE family RNA methyltransferase, partial [Candidatus Wallbacteria bacterium]|nr:RsmE family RNA methyltransferase [Candidatus Wallbacteria bacterium]